MTQITRISADKKGFFLGEPQETGIGLLHEGITEKVIKAFYSVNNALGFGFLEKVYENAMAIELRKMDCIVEPQVNIKAFYDGKEVGDYYADLLVDNSVIVELKAAESLCKEHEVQLINYLRATSIEVGLLLNFGKKAEFRRKVFANARKKLPRESASSALSAFH